MRETLQRDHDGLEAFQRFAGHLTKHDIDLNETQAVLGPWVTLDAETERFAGPLAAEANALLKRQ